MMIFLLIKVAHVIFSKENYPWGSFSKRGEQKRGKGEEKEEKREEKEEKREEKEGKGKKKRENVKCAPLL